MDNQQSSNSGFELPVPGAAAGTAGHEAAGATEQVTAPAFSPEKLPAVGNVPGGSPLQPLTTAPAAPAEPPAFTVPVANPAASAPVAPIATPAIADDADLIEKEWVQKAKAVVERTRQDPYEQNKEISKVRADYIKKRYNRDIAVAES